MSRTPKTSEILAKHRLTESEINMLKRRLNTRAWIAAVTWGEPKPLPPSVREEVPTWFDRPYKITPEQTAKGVAWIRGQYLKRDGTPRRLSVQLFTPDEIAVMQAFQRFEFVGFHDTSENSRRFYQPVYRVHAKDGRWFDYVAGPYGLKDGGRWKRLLVLDSNF